MDDEEECGREVGNSRAERRTRSISSVPASRLAERCRSRTPSCLGATPSRKVVVDTLDSFSRTGILPVSASGDPATGGALATAASLSLSLRIVRCWGATASAAHLICGRAAATLVSQAAVYEKACHLPSTASSLTYEKWSARVWAPPSNRVLSREKRKRFVAECRADLDDKSAWGVPGERARSPLACMRTRIVLS